MTWRGRIVYSLCTCLLFCFFIILLKVVLRQVFVNKLKVDSPFIHIIFRDMPEYGKPVTDDFIDWEKIYPFCDDDESFESDTSKQNYFSKIYNSLLFIKKKLSEYSSIMIPMRRNVIELSVCLEKYLGWNMPYVSKSNPIMELEDNYFVFTQKAFDVSEQCASIVALRNFCDKTNTKFFYVLAPSKVSEEDCKGILKNKDFSVSNSKKIIDELTKNRVNFLNIFKEIDKEVLDHHSLFFCTDHHWKPETGLWTAGLMLKYMNEHFGQNFDLRFGDIKCYRADIYENWFLGVQGKKLTKERASPENISLLYPKFKTRLRFQIPSHKLDRVGDFSSIYDMDEIATISYTDKNPYGAYAFGHLPLLPLVKYTNLLETAKDKNILLIRDSFSNVVAPFLALALKRLDVIDLRSFTGSLKSYIEKNKPDIVIVIYSIGTLEDINWARHTSLYDLR